MGCLELPGLEEQALTPIGEWLEGLKSVAMELLPL